MAEITYQDLTIDEIDVFEKMIQVTGGKKTDWTTPEGKKFDHVNVTVSEPYHKDGSFGRGASNYRYGTAADLERFLNFKTPFNVKCKMFTATDDKGNSIGIILDIDFNTVQEVELVPRQKVTPKSAPVASSAPAPATPKAQL